jgi:hypothetical protein
LPRNQHSLQRIETLQLVRNVVALQAVGDSLSWQSVPLECPLAGLTYILRLFAIHAAHDSVGECLAGDVNGTTMDVYSLYNLTVTKNYINVQKCQKTAVISENIAILNM